MSFFYLPQALIISNNLLMTMWNNWKWSTRTLSILHTYISRICRHKHFKKSYVNMCYMYRDLQHMYWCFFLFSVEPEPEPDHLTCGECQQDFQLGDIVHFIQHKVLRCETEKVASDSCVNPEDDQSPDQEGLPSESKAVICSHRTSISAPISQRRQTSELRDKSKSQSSEVETSEMTEDDRHEKGDEDSVRPPPSVAMEMPEAARPQCIDAEANTVRTGQFYLFLFISITF